MVPNLHCPLVGEAGSFFIPGLVKKVAAMQDMCTDLVFSLRALTRWIRRLLNHLHNSPFRTECQNFLFFTAVPGAKPVVSDDQGSLAVYWDAQWPSQEMSYIRDCTPPLGTTQVPLTDRRSLSATSLACVPVCDIWDPEGR